MQCRNCKTEISKSTCAGLTDLGHVIHLCRTCSANQCYISRWKYRSATDIKARISRLKEHLIILENMVKEK